MQPQHYLKTAVCTVLLLVLCIGLWEIYWRTKGFIPTYNDDKSLWAEKRKQVYANGNKATVFIGSSRIKFDLDIPTWKKISGEDAIQLSLVGTSPLLLLEDLANDERFKGKLVIDVTEPLFFSQNPAFHFSASESIEFFKKQTLSEKLSSKINFALESKFAFLEEKRFALNTLFNDLQLNNRKGVFAFPSFPKGFEWTTIDRQTYMSEMFLRNPEDINKQTSIWTSLIMGDKTPPASGKALEKILENTSNWILKIKSRGGRVIFIRTPSSGPMGEGENAAFPREKYWNALLEKSSTGGIHFRDYEVTKHLICPEWSHLSIAQARSYTQNLFKILYEKKWFQNN